ncbi:hypothetical protein C7C46_29160 [Streptomyces tateyamensis]|uniref:Bulb-type lectin domain-containing protein n=2 Tax=Streptomyces tateyamensis TaxID=565073 RepID=A0A2V4NJ28_9ACTN|nr:hypothetical protein C7C46_29160 [Streptomyces tateyamensis]
MDLTPDQNVLGKGTGPWYLDPSVSISRDSATQHWVQVQENHPDTKNYDVNSPVGTGYCAYSDCTGYGRYRAYFDIGINSDIYNQPGGAPSPPTVYDSKLIANVSDASSPSTNTPFGLYWTGAINTNTTWNAQPCGTNGTMAGCQKIGNSASLTGTGPISFDVTSQIQQAASQHWGDWTVGIAPDDENNALYRHHLSISPGSAPHITTNYDIQPSAWGPTTSPKPGFASTGKYFDCNSGGTNPWDNVGWIGANQTVKLAVNTWSPAYLSLHTSFNVFWNSTAGNGSYNQDSGWGGSVNTDTNAQNTTLALSQLQDGQVYGWHAGAYDGDANNPGLGSPWTQLCYFGIDRTPPTVSISSPEFPPSGTPNPTPQKFAGQQARFTLHGTDPVPTGAAASGVACYRVSTNPSPVTGWHCTDGATNGVYLNNTATNSADFNTTPGNWGTNILYAQAQDNAGNYSQPAAYAFYAPWNPASKPVLGDVTGDGKPDIVVPDNAGNLKIVSTTIDPTNSVSANASLAPGSQGWAGAQISHRGSLLPAKSVDDLIAHVPSDPTNLYELVNNGSGAYTVKTPISAPPTDSCTDGTGNPLPTDCPAELTDWSQTSQIVAIGRPEGDYYTPANGSTPSSVSRTSLIAVINKHLWLFHGAPESNKIPGFYFDGTAVELSSADWTNYDLINPGPANGITPGTTAKQPTLWARNRTDGTIHAYRITGGNTPNYSDFANPATNGITLPGITLPVSTYPTVGASADLAGGPTTANAPADLWTVNTSNQLTIWTGTSADGTDSTPVTGFVTTGSPNTVTLPTPKGLWQLNDKANSTTAADSLGQDLAQSGTALGTHPGTASNVTFSPDNPSGATLPIDPNTKAPITPPNVAVFNGSTSKIETTGPIVDPTKSFTVSAWAKPSAYNGVVLGQDAGNTQSFMLWPDSNGNVWHFAMATADPTNGWPYDVTSDVNTNANVQLNTWTQLSASYNATTGQMSLYVNGNLAGIGQHKPFSSTAGSFTIGRWQNNGNKNASPFSGSISDVSVYNAPSTPGNLTASMAGGTVLHPGDSAYSSRTMLTMQADGNLVLYTLGGLPLWSTNTNGHPGAYATMQADGNLVVYQPDPKFTTPGAAANSLWSSGTPNNPGATAKVQGDCNFVIYDTNNKPLWASNTYHP